MSVGNEVIYAEKAAAFIKCFKGTSDMEVGMKVNIRYDGPDTILHTYDLEDGRLLNILEIDFVQSIEDMRYRIELFLGYEPEFYEVKNPIKKFEAAAPYKHAKIYKLPKNPGQILKYGYPSMVTSDYLFGFIFLGKPSDKISLS